MNDDLLGRMDIPLLATRVQQDLGRWWWWWYCGLGRGDLGAGRPRASGTHDSRDGPGMCNEERMGLTKRNYNLQ